VRSGRILALVTDGFGGRGGIALYGRHVLRALCSHPRVGRVVAIPRSVSYAAEALPERLEYAWSAADGLWEYAWAVATRAVLCTRPDLIVCGHLHLLPVARVLQTRFRSPVLLLTYGVEAWKPTSHAMSNFLARDVKYVASIRQFTLDQLANWSGMRPRGRYLLPNCVDPSRLEPGPKRPDLEERWSLRGKKVVMTAGRMDASPLELRKGFDEVLEAMPAMLRSTPDLVYMVVGDGPEQANLERKASSLGVSEHVRFVGYVREEEKADYYRLADVFAMPGSNPAFDTYPFRFAFLEALACGLPVVAARMQLESERTHPDVESLLILVDPNDPGSVAEGISRGLARSAAGATRQAAVASYFYEPFERKAHAIVDDILARG